MESASNIRTLLESYFDGDTSLAQERELRNYFTSGEVATEFEEYTQLFSAFAKAQQEILPQPVKAPMKIRSNNSPLHWMSGVAAAVVITAGVYLSMNQQDTLTSSYENEELAILKTKQALGMMSQMLSESTTQLEVVQEFDKASSTLFK